MKPHDTICGTAALLCRDVTYVVPYSGEDTQLLQRMKMLEIPRFPVTYEAGSICLSEHSVWSSRDIE